MLGWHAADRLARLGAVNAWLRSSLVAIACLAGGLGLVAGCSGGGAARGTTTPSPVSPGGTASDGEAGSGAGSSGGAAPSAPRGKPGTPLLDPSGTSCAASSCAFHAGGGGYFHCLAGGAGSCFHFGSPCQPADACMFDPADRGYKKCSEIVEGKCLRFGAACEPSGACWYRPEDRLYHECLQRKPGGCAKWGELCAPATAPSS